MRPSIAKRLVDLNRQFYQTFALQFSSTRQRLQPGVLRILDRLIPSLSPRSAFLDLGCGNGELAIELARRGTLGTYVGLDFSAEMLHEARSRQEACMTRLSAASLTCTFLQADLAEPGWEQKLQGEALPLFYPALTAFAILHHLPGEALRSQAIGAAKSRLAPGGFLALSVWQFLNSERLRGRIQPWEAAGISGEDVDPGDYILDWRQGGSGLRYAHHFTEGELAQLAAQNGFTVEESFLSDGEGRKLGLYQVWRRTAPGEHIA